MKNVIKLAKGSLNKFFKTSFNDFLSQQLTHDGYYKSSTGKRSLYVSLLKSEIYIVHLYYSLTDGFTDCFILWCLPLSHTIPTFNDPEK